MAASCHNEVCPFLISAIPTTMNYQETISYLFSSTPVFEHVGASAYKEGLHNTVELDKHFGMPHRRFKSIHIAGTNGKGSCSHAIAAILQQQDYKVGLYTSPHLIDFKERIRVNGKCISEQYVIDFVEHERSFFEPLHPSFFELTTAMAFKYFADMQVDYAVIEVGLGGRLDCTNIITPILSVITNISLDHTQFLGNTPAKIAAEKAGIIKHGVPVVIGETNAETRPVFTAKAEEVQAPVVFAEDEPEVTSAQPNAKGDIDYASVTFGVIHGELSGTYQQKNMNTVLWAIRCLRQAGTEITDESLLTAAANVSGLTGLMGRWQRIGDKPTVVCDTGHNPGGWQYLKDQIAAQQCDTTRIVFGMVDDKDVDSVLDMLPRNARLYLTQAGCKRAIPVDVLSEKARLHGLGGKSFSTVASAYDKAMADSSPNDFVFIGGSSYVVADLLSELSSRGFSFGNTHD